MQIFHTHYIYYVIHYIIRQVQAWASRWELFQAALGHCHADWLRPRANRRAAHPFAASPLISLYKSNKFLCAGFQPSDGRPQILTATIAAAEAAANGAVAALLYADTLGADVCFPAALQWAQFVDRYDLPNLR